MELKEKETKHFVLMYNSSPTNAHGKHAYTRRGANPKSCVGFVCLKSQGCCWEMSSDMLTIQKPSLPIVKQKVSDSLSQSHQKRKTNMANSLKHQSNKQGALMSQKENVSGGVRLSLLPQTSPSGFCLQMTLASISISSILGGFCLYLNLFYSGCSKSLSVRVQFHEGYVLQIHCLLFWLL